MRTLLAAAIVWGFSAEIALACSGSPCFSPRVVPEMGSVPLDQFKLQFWPGRDAAKETMNSPARLFAVANGARTEVALRSEPMKNANGVVLTPEAPVTAGTQLVLEADAPDCSEAKDLSASFLVTSAAPIPSALGKLESTLHHSMLEVATVAGSCSVSIDAAWADLVVMLDAAAKPFADVIVYRLVIDGALESSFASSLIDPEPLSRGQERVYAACKPNDKLVGNLALGKHRARLRGELPSGATLESDEVELVLTCQDQPPSAADEDAGAGLPRPPDAGTSSNAGASAAGRMGSERAAAGSRDEAAGSSAAAAGSAAGASDPGRGSGGGCGVGQSSSVSCWAWALAAIAACLRRRRARFAR